MTLHLHGETATPSFALAMKVQVIRHSALTDSGRRDTFSLWRVPIHVRMGLNIHVETKWKTS